MRTCADYKGMQTGGAEQVGELEARLQSMLSGKVRALRLVRRDEGLVLQGSAHTYYAKQLAQQAVMALTESPIVANEIEVVEAGGLRP